MGVHAWVCVFIYVYVRARACMCMLYCVCGCDSNQLGQGSDTEGWARKGGKGGKVRVYVKGLGTVFPRKGGDILANTLGYINVIPPPLSPPLKQKSESCMCSSVLQSRTIKYLLKGRIASAS